MRRRQLVEIEDLLWCPRTIRDGGTDWLGFIANASGAFAVVAPKIRAAMQAAGTSRVLDLCSGAGGPWLSLGRALAASGPVEVVLSDLYPNLEALATVRARSRGTIGFLHHPVDATNVPIELEGVRTMFNAFHHFPPELARAILADAVAKRRAIAIVEGASSRVIGLFLMPLQVPAIFLLTPFVRPFRWSRLFFTYLLPLIPALILFDGVVSFLRLYLADDLRELVKSVPGHDRFDWDIGITPYTGLPIGMTHLIGVPRRE